MKVIRQILSNASGLTALLEGGANGIYIGKAKQGAGPPYIVILERGVQPYNSQDSGADLMKFEHRILIFGTNVKEIKDIRKQVNLVLDNARNETYDGDTLWRSYLEDSDFMAIKEDNINYYMEELTFITILTTD